MVDAEDEIYIESRTSCTRDCCCVLKIDNRQEVVRAEN